MRRGFYRHQPPRSRHQEAFDDFSGLLDPRPTFSTDRGRSLLPIHFRPRPCQLTGGSYLPSPPPTPPSAPFQRTSSSDSQRIRGQDPWNSKPTPPPTPEWLRRALTPSWFDLGLPPTPATPSQPPPQPIAPVQSLSSSFGTRSSSNTSAPSFLLIVSIILFYLSLRLYTSLSH